MSNKYVTVRELIKEIATSKTHNNANSKDEETIALAMLNDRSYVVDVYDKKGNTTQYSPFSSSRSVVANIIETVNKTTPEEANNLAQNYEFKKEDAKSIVEFSKEFINTYLHTGRKLPLGSRARSNVSLLEITKEARTTNYPAPTGIDSSGQKTYELATSSTPEYDTIKVCGKCPSYLKKKK